MPVAKTKARVRSRPVTTAEAARIAAGLTLVQAASRARVCTEYLRQIERRGGASYVLALRLSRMYDCPMTAFLYPRFGGR